MDVVHLVVWLPLVWLLCRVLVCELGCKNGEEKISAKGG